MKAELVKAEIAGFQFSVSSISAFRFQLSAFLQSAFNFQLCLPPSPTCILTPPGLPPTMDSLIELNPQICNGRPVVRGTRISVETVLTYLCAGDSVEDVLAAHPRLTRQSILACLDYARRLSAAHSTLKLAS